MAAASSTDVLNLGHAAASSSSTVCTAAAFAAATATASRLSAAVTATVMVAAAAAAMPTAPDCQCSKGDDLGDGASTAASDVGIEERLADFVESDDEQEDNLINQPAIWASCQDASLVPSKARWADMADLSEEEEKEEVAHQPAKVAWADMADSDEEEASDSKEPVSTITPGVAPEEPLSGEERVKPKRRRRGKKATSSPAETEPATGSVSSKTAQPAAAGCQSRPNSKSSADNKQTWWSQPWAASGTDWQHAEDSSKNWRSSQQWGSKTSAKSRQGERKAASGGKTQCQFFIGIDEEPKFKVTRKVLGSHGKHMKAVAESTGAKLRLRGCGSGFLEGPEQVESTDELMLCVSVTDESGYAEAVRQVWELLEGVHKEYRAFCAKSGWPEPTALAVRMHEGPRPAVAKHRRLRAEAFVNIAGCCTRFQIGA